MILIDRNVTHRFIHNPEWTSIESKWHIKLEKSDIPDFDTRWRFDYMEIIQRKRLSTGKIDTWFKGSRTTMFDKSTKDKQKIMVIAMLERYLLDNNIPLIHHYESVEE